MEDLIKLLKSLEDSGLLKWSKRAKSSKWSKIAKRRILTGKWAVATSQGRRVNKKGKGIIRAGDGFVRAGYGNKENF